jgi:transposase
VLQCPLGAGAPEGDMGMRPREVSDAFWAKVEPPIPPPARDPNGSYRRALGASRKRKPTRPVFEGVVCVLHTGCQWKVLPKEFGSFSSVRRYFLEWEKAGASRGCGRPAWSAGAVPAHPMPSATTWRAWRGSGRA